LSHVQVFPNRVKAFQKTVSSSAGISLKTTHRFGAHLEGNHARTSAPSEEDAFHEFDAYFFSPALRRTLCSLRSRGTSRQRIGHRPELESCAPEQSCTGHGAYAAAH
jgi:hypothetical protein